MARRSILKRFGFTALVAIIAGRFSPSLNCRSRLISPDGTPRDRIWVGNHGENVATAWLRSKGCVILARNFRSHRKGEVDIVARDGKLLLFIEVKTRREGARIRGLDAVGKAKQALIERGANAWLKRLRSREIPWRFDVIEVTVEDGKKPSVNHIRDAF
ncbi:MAG: YraN family protein [Verrucomicrobiaceae bacterium]|nr:MAG: YraN family protein [Verrucomicrobiaceae bacterium]